MQPGISCGEKFGEDLYWFILWTVSPKKMHLESWGGILIKYLTNKQKTEPDCRTIDLLLTPSMCTSWPKLDLLAEAEHGVIMINPPVKSEWITQSSCLAGHSRFPSKTMMRLTANRLIVLLVLSRRRIPASRQPTCPRRMSNLLSRRISAQKEWKFHISPPNKTQGVPTTSATRSSDVTTSLWMTNRTVLFLRSPLSFTNRSVALISL